MEPGSVARIIDAIGFAAEAHRHQRRKDAEASPYINHPIALLRILAVEGAIDDPHVLCAAALHDYLEDCCGGPGQPTLEEGRATLRGRFGPEVLAHVEAVSDDKSLAKEDRKRLQVEHAAHASPAARLVKLADKIANLRDISMTPPASWTLERRRAYFDWAKQVIDQVRGTHPRLEALFDAEYERRPEES